MPSAPSGLAALTGPSALRWWRLAAVGALAVNLYALYAPSVDTPSVPGVRVDLGGHALTFAALVLTALMARVPVRVVLIGAATNAVVSEAVQHWLLPDRSGDPTDLVADLVGIALGWAAWRFLLSRRAGGTPAPGRRDPAR